MTLYIDTQQALEDFVVQCTAATTLAIDTEFLREKTYYPQLCLLQLATESQVAIIDPLASLDLQTLVPLFTDERITKVFHAGDQDRLILYQALGTITKPVFDTQRAALLLGLPEQMSLVTLVRHYHGISLEKGESFSDWLRRPLAPAQLAYAADDVRYLPDIYNTMVSELKSRGRLTWLNDDFRAMEDEELYRVDCEEVWKKLKGISSLKSSQLATVRAVASWREHLAQQRNLPRKWILTDELLVEVARKQPTSLEELFQIRGIKDRLGMRWSQEMLASVAAAGEQAPGAWPVREQTQGRRASTTAKLDLMNALLHHRAKELHIASSFLTNRDELVSLAAGTRKGLMILKGWRRELIGDELLRLLDGELSLALDGEELKVTLLSQAERPCAQ
ncbi:MAG: ribonuclease D [Coriobacteriales bacterium]|jgi:ribonuclease D|nr:ribonuclease D [Coriobacteriales bacterium]